MSLRDVQSIALGKRVSSRPGFCVRSFSWLFDRQQAR